MGEQKSVIATITMPVTAKVTYSASYGEAWEIEDLRKQLLDFAHAKIAKINSCNVELRVVADPTRMRITLEEFK